ncbi:MAG TPA: sugar phosphorylase [Anaerolineae bacterium]|nr:sugar phosphorylase [Anaerolineae bacterium]
MPIEDQTLFDDLAFLYGSEHAGPVYEHLASLLTKFHKEYPELRSRPVPGLATGRYDERDSILITYGDMVRAEGQAPVRTLARFLDRRLKDVVSAVHILPFYPYSSDDGFSVVDYLAVDPALGDWGDVARVGRHFRLMFDAVINHISAESVWFKGFLANNPGYRDYFVVVEPGADLSQVFRPRALPLLTPVQQSTDEGKTVERLVWTTFSADQIDLNFANPDVLLEIVEVLLFYCAHGCDFIRLDAIAYMWKEIGTSSIHLPQTHRIIQFLRRVLDQVAPRVALITETNVPHEQNVSYFGNGTNEAQLVYNFSLPPLTLHAFHTGDATRLRQWAQTLTLPSDQVTFFNFLASHDGIGLMPARQLLAEEEVADMARRVERLGGRVSYKINSDGTQSAYELNVNYLDALGDPDAPADDHQLLASRFLTAQAIMLALRGVPGIYFHSLFGSRGWPEGVAETGRARTINRQKLKLDELDTELSTPDHLRHLVYHGYVQLLEARRQHPAFHPNADQEILLGNDALFSLRRTSQDGQRQVICIHNVSGRRQLLRLEMEVLGLEASSRLADLLGGPPPRSRDGQTVQIEVQAYGRAWIDVRRAETSDR